MENHYINSEKEITDLNDFELVQVVSKIFSNLGWTVNLQKKVFFGDRPHSLDIVLLFSEHVCGIVEVFAPLKTKNIMAKREQIKTIINYLKPEIFILTNGFVFEIFYDGKFFNSQSIPPSIQTFHQIKKSIHKS